MSDRERYDLLCKVDDMYRPGEGLHRNAEAFRELCGELLDRLDRLERAVMAASALAGCLNEQDRDEKKCPVCGAAHGEPHCQGCPLENYCKLIREGEYR